MDPKAVLFLRYCIQSSSIALLYYDYLLTLPSEIQLIWKRKMSWTSLLYFLCRYALVANLLYLVSMGGHFGPHTARMRLFVVSASIAGRAAILAIWTGRTWAVWEMNPWILGVLLSLLLSVVGLDIASAVMVDSIQLERAMGILIVIHEWLSAGLTMYRCITILRAQDEDLPTGAIYRELMQQGALYILAVSVLTISAPILAFHGTNGPVQRLLNALTLPVSGLLTARFVLHMRQLNQKEKNSYFLESKDFAFNHSLFTDVEITTFDHADSDEDASIDSIEEDHQAGPSGFGIESV